MHRTSHPHSRLNTATRGYPKSTSAWIPPSSGDVALRRRSPAKLKLYVISYCVCSPAIVYGVRTGTPFPIQCTFYFSSFLPHTRAPHTLQRNTYTPPLLNVSLVGPSKPTHYKKPLTWGNLRPRSTIPPYTPYISTRFGAVCMGLRTL